MTKQTKKPKDTQVHEARSAIVSIREIEFHDNGDSGAPFYAMVFEDSIDRTPKLGIVFANPSHIAVLDLAKLARHDVTSAPDPRLAEHNQVLRYAIANCKPAE